MNVINLRQSLIVQDILNGKLKTLSDYSKEHSVSERTIRYDIRDINESFDNKLSVVIKPDGCISFSDIKNLDLEFITSVIKNKDYSTYKLSASERKALIALTLLESCIGEAKCCATIKSDEYITINSICERLLVSRNTVVNDIDELKVWFEENSVTLVSSSGKGIKLDGVERDIRDCMVKLVVINGGLLLSGESDENNVFYLLLMRELDKRAIITEIEDIILKAERKFDIRLADFSYRELVIFCLIMINRIKYGNKVTYSGVLNWDELIKSSKYGVSIYLAELFSKKFSIEFDDDERAELLESLRRKSYIKNNGARIEMLEEQILINEFIYKISSSLRMNYYLDFGFYDMLISHLRAAIHRIRRGQFVENPMLEQLQELYPEVFLEIKANIVKIEEYLERKFSDNEISFIAMYIISLVERIKAENFKVEALLVCNSGQSMIQLVSAKINVQFPQINIFDTISSHQFEYYDLTGIDLVLSTIHIKNSDVPCVQISPILGQNDIFLIQSHIGEIQNEKYKSKMRSSIKKE